MRDRWLRLLLSVPQHVHPKGPKAFARPTATICTTTVTRRAATTTRNGFVNRAGRTPRTRMIAAPARPAPLVRRTAPRLAELAEPVLISRRWPARLADPRGGALEEFASRAVLSARAPVVDVSAIEACDAPAAAGVDALLLKGRAWRRCSIAPGSTAVTTTSTCSRRLAIGPGGGRAGRPGLREPHRDTGGG